ncbi:DNA ligase 1 [Sesamum indicum]|uniref:DNA ligase 1 n=1 Tax=Sesamum indicum TaxID=4182 RepID=A0A6I9TN54_SESIN|nr:DNA ligase 1 [Sesamum indicum]XP_020551198.1 DNA ligase 1 [Sesamum indicum]
MAEEEGEQRGIEQQLERAVCSRLQHFKDQADSLTLESVRRLLEKDLGLEKFALDAHKRFIRQYLEKKMDGADDSNPKTATENVDKDMHLNKEETTILSKKHEEKNDPKRSGTGDEEMTEDSPIMGVLTPKSEVATQGSSVSENRIQKAIWDRADHFSSNSENLTLAGVRRLLEEDLGLDKNTLDPFKKFISQQIDQVLNSPKGAKSAKDIKKKTSANLKSKKSKKTSSGEGSESPGSESDEMEHKVKSRKEAASRRNTKKSEQPKKRKISKESDLDVSGKKQSKLAKRQKEEDNDSDEDGGLSEDGQSQSSIEKPAQKKEKSAPGYGKQVENLKSIIKACGMSVAPSIYKKAKQVPDGKREAFIVKELEGILSREGLSKNPTEKEIRDCKKRKETARELEGIDMSNIISSSRRRSTFTFVTPEKPGNRAKKDKVDAKDSKNKDSNDKDHNGDSKGEKEKEEEKVEKEEKEEKEDEEEEEEEAVEEEVEDDDEEEEEEEEDDESEEFNEGDDDESD